MLPRLLRCRPPVADKQRPLQRWPLHHRRLFLRRHLRATMSQPQPQPLAARLRVGLRPMPALPLLVAMAPRRMPAAASFLADGNDGVDAAGEADLISSRRRRSHPTATTMENSSCAEDEEDDLDLGGQDSIPSRPTMTTTAVAAMEAMAVVIAGLPADGE